MGNLPRGPGCSRSVSAGCFRVRRLERVAALPRDGAAHRAMLARRLLENQGITLQSLLPGPITNEVPALVNTVQFGKPLTVVVTGTALT